jgi:tRNA-Thr(GGU) m(6)t(6)A37 methyltransferase TsaA
MQELVLRPIGEVRSQYTKPYHAPRQVGADDRCHEAVVRLYKHATMHQALHDLDGFDRIWLVAWFDRIQGWKPKILTPRSRIKRGVLATRSPHRPNPIGISVVELLGIQGLDIHIGGCDLLDGTPILDIKPYLPYADAFPNAKAGWVDDLTVPPYSVSWHCTPPDNPALVLHVNRTLALDPAPHPYRRIRSAEGGTGVLAVEHWRIHFRIDGMDVVVLAVHAAEPA